MTMTNSIVNIEKKLIGISKDISYIRKSLDGNGGP